MEKNENKMELNEKEKAYNKTELEDKDINENEDIENINDYKFKKGLTYEEYLNFISFLDDLNITTQNNQDKENNKQEFIIDHEIEGNSNNEIKMYNNNDIGDIYLSKITVLDNNLEENVPEIINYNGRNSRIISNNEQESENRILNIRIKSFDIRREKKENFGEIDKNDKEIIKDFLSSRYKNSELLLKLYTEEQGQFYVIK